MGLYLWDAIAGGVVRGEAPVDLPPRRWVHLEACYVWSTAATGRVTFWQDGEQIIDVRDVRTEHPSEEPDARQWSIDNYTDGIDPPDLSILVDDAAISTGRLGP
jgi:hypothetical protein